MSPPVPLTPKASYRIEQIPGKGQGLIAAGEIKVGEIIISEAPSLKLKRGTEHRKDFETSQLKLQLKKLPRHLQERILKLHAAHGYPKKHRLQDIFYTNCFDGSDNHKVMYMDISFVNHSCRPNTQLVYDVLTQKSNLRAIRDITEGEELLNDYRGATDDSKSRQAILKDKYGFDCDCERCTAPKEVIEERDKKVHRLRELESLPSIPDRETGLRVLRESSQLYKELEILGPALCDFLIAATSLMCTMQLLDRAAALAVVAKSNLQKFGLQGNPTWRGLQPLFEVVDLKAVRVAAKKATKERGMWWIIDEKGEWNDKNWAQWLWVIEEEGTGEV